MDGDQGFWRAQLELVEMVGVVVGRGFVLGWILERMALGHCCKPKE